MKLYDKKIYDTLLKCNDIGRKFGAKGMYNIINGMIMFHPYERAEDLYDDIDIGIHIGFMHDQIISGLSELIYIPLLVNGIALYDIDKECGSGFQYIEILDDVVKIVYEITCIDTSKLFNDFWSMIEIDHAPLFKYFEDPNAIYQNIELIQLYKEFVNSYTGIETTISQKIELPILKRNVNDIIFQRVNKYMNISKTFMSDKLQEKVLDSDITDVIIKSGQPKKITFDLGDCGGQFELRLMKSMFKCVNKTSEVTIKVIPIDGQDFAQNIIVNRLKQFTICSSYKSLIF